MFSKPLQQTSPSELTSVHFVIIPDDNWDAFLSATTCKEKLEYNRIAKSVEIPNAGNEWSAIVEQVLNQHARRRTYFFVLMDCEGNIQGKNSSGLKIEFEIEMLNVDNSHFSSEEEGFLYPYFFLMLVCSYFLAKNVQKIIRQYNKEEELDWAFLLANATLLFQLLNIFFDWLHMVIYASNGHGSFVLQLFGLIFGIASQFTMAIIFILVSWGWTINYTELENFDIYIPLAVLLGIVHMMIMGLSKITDDESSKFHSYGGFAGWVIVVLRLGMYVYFMFGIRDTLKTAREKVKMFISKFMVFGSIYFLAFPIILFISAFIASYVQHKVITIGTLLMQSIAIIIMSLLFTVKSGDYYNASLRSNPLLPTGKNE